MIGIVIVTHRQLGDALVDAADFILDGKPDATATVSVDINEPADKLRKKIVEAVKGVDQKKGVLILTDMFGGTPSNLSYSLLEEGKIEVIAGVNLPMLIKAVGSRERLALSELAETLETYGKGSISLASRILKGNKRG